MKNVYVKPQLVKTEVATENAILIGSVFNQEGNHTQLTKRQFDALPANFEVKEGIEENAVSTKGHKFI